MLRSSVSCRKLRSSTLRLRSKFDFIQSKDAVWDNYEKMGFRSIGNQIVDASNVVNSVALQQYQSQYSIPAALKPKLPNLLLSSGSVEKAIQILQTVPNINRLDYGTKVQCVHILSTKYRSDLQKIPEFGPLYLSIIDGLEAAEATFISPILSISKGMGLGPDSNVMTKISKIISNQINYIGLVDCAKLAFYFQPDSITYALLHQRAKILYEEILLNRLELIPNLIQTVFDFVTVLLLFKDDKAYHRQ